MRAISDRTGPLHLILRDAAGRSPDLALIRDSIASRRADNMRLFAQDLLDTGDLRPDIDIDIDEIADVVWSMNSAEFHDLLIHQRGWSSAAVENWLANTWCRLFLDDDHQAP